MIAIIAIVAIIGYYSLRPCLSGHLLVYIKATIDTICISTTIILIHIYIYIHIILYIYRERER